MSDPVSDPKKGGDLNDMAQTGATIPGDAGKMNLIPSVPNPHQREDTADGMGHPDLAGAADNAVDIPRSTRDQGSGLGEGVTGTGHVVRGEVDTKNTHMEGADNPLAKGSTRYAKHQRQKDDGDLQGETEVEAAPGEEGEDQETLRERRGA